MTLLSVRSLTTAFRTGRGEIAAIEDVSFDVAAGEIVALVGESGSGKSVTALTIMGLLPQPPARVAGGAVLFDGVDLTRLSDRAMERVRGPGIGMIFQEPMTSLNPVFTIGEQICETIRAHERVTAKAQRARAVELLTRVGIPSPASRMDQFPHALSGGQRQRVMIAIALACRPRLLIADEPTTALDVTIQAQILALLLELRDETGMAILLITHNMGVVAETADRVMVMYAGRIVEAAPAARLFDAPLHPYTRGLLACIPPLGARLDRLVAIPGTLPDALHRPPGCRFAPRCSLAIGACTAALPPLVEDAPGHFAACIRVSSLSPLSPVMAGLVPAIHVPAEPPAQPTRVPIRNGRLPLHDVAGRDTPGHDGEGDRPRRDEPLLSVRDLTKHYRLGGDLLGRNRDTLRAVDGVSFDIAPGETLGLVGESGCGKSTLGRLLIRLLDPTGGQIVFDGQDISGLDRAALRTPRQKMQIVFQDPYGALNPRMAAEDIVMEPLLIAGGRADAAARESVAAMLERVGLPRGAGRRYPHEFSGGQRQRIGLARALVLRPRLLICDEPVSALDVSVQAQIVNLVQDLQAELGLTTLFIAHDLGVVAHIADRVAVMYLGEIVEIARAADLAARPLHPYTQALISAVPVSHPALRATARARLAGDVPSAMAPPAGCRFHTRCPLAFERCQTEPPRFVATAPGIGAACHLHGNVTPSDMRR